MIVRYRSNRGYLHLLAPPKHEFDLCHFERDNESCRVLSIKVRICNRIKIGGRKAYIRGRTQFLFQANFDYRISLRKKERLKK